jgi:hypothetical protein
MIQGVEQEGFLTGREPQLPDGMLERIKAMPGLGGQHAVDHFFRTLATAEGMQQFVGRVTEHIDELWSNPAGLVAVAKIVAQGGSYEIGGLLHTVIDGALVFDESDAHNAASRLQFVFEVGYATPHDAVTHLVIDEMQRLLQLDDEGRINVPLRRVEQAMRYMVHIAQETDVPVSLSQVSVVQHAVSTLEDYAILAPFSRERVQSHIWSIGNTYSAFGPSANTHRCIVLANEAIDRVKALEY